MNREHLYKAKRVNWRELPKEEWWVEGYLYQNLVKAFIILQHTGEVRNGLFKEDVNTEFSACGRWVDPITVCKYIGRTDKNNEKIWENDIVVNDDGKIGQVQWFEEHLAFMIWCVTDNKVYFAYDNDFSKIEVIGNIFDNPELLKGGEE